MELKILGCFLLFVGITNFLREGISSLPGFIVSCLFCILGIKCLLRKRPVRKTNSNDNSGFGGHTHGEIIDLGNGESFDSYHADSIVDGVNWKSDGQGGYYNSGTGETIEYNNGGYSYYDSSSDES